MLRPSVLLRVVHCLLAILGTGALRAEELRLVARYPIEGVFRHVKSFTVEPRGNLLVVDSEGPLVVQVDSAGKRVRTYSQSGRRYCEIAGPTAVASVADGFVLFDFGRQHLLRFGPNGECQSDDLLRTFQADAMAMKGNRIVGAGSLMKKVPGERCVFFSTDSAASLTSAACLLTIKNDKLWLLYGREFVDASGTAAYYMVPYEPVLYISNGTAAARAVPLRGLGVTAATLPSNEEQIRMDRTRFFDFYNGQALVEGVAATSAGVVVAARTPGNASKLDLQYFKDGSPTASATASLMLPRVAGAYPVHIRGNGGDRVYVLVANGTHPSLHYEVVVYQLH